jgi:HEAT repeat protein
VRRLFDSLRDRAVRVMGLGSQAETLAGRLFEGKLPEDVERVGQQVQRIGQRAFGRMLKRWPVLADLVADPKKSLRRRATTAGPMQTAREDATSRPARFQSADETSLEVLCVQLVAAAGWQQRAGAARELAHMQGDGVVQALTHALRDTSVEVAIAAVDALSERVEPSAVQALRTVIDNADGYFSPMTRVAALSVLGRVLSDAELAPIVACVRDLDAEVSIAAIAVVADRKRTAAAVHLLPILSDQTGFFLPLVRLAAANALTHAGALGPDLASQLLQSEQAQAVRRVLERAAACPP